MLIVEVLSPSTADFDRRGKFFFYRQLASLKEYVLIDTDEPMWMFTPFTKKANGYLKLIPNFHKVSN